jgi:hypothetical protein
MGIERKMVLMWLNKATELSQGQIMFIPVEKSKRPRYVRLCKKIVEDMEAYFNDSAYHGLVAYGTQKNGICYVVIERKPRITDVAYIVDKNNREKPLRLLAQSKHTRLAQIAILLEEGYSAAEIRQALGENITLKEKEFLEKI